MAGVRRTYAPVPGIRQTAAHGGTHRELLGARNRTGRPSDRSVRRRAAVPDQVAAFASSVPEFALRPGTAGTLLRLSPGPEPAASGEHPRRADGPLPESQQ